LRAKQVHLALRQQSDGNDALGAAGLRRLIHIKNNALKRLKCLRFVSLT
jgi:hypothetical protein